MRGIDPDRYTGLVDRLLGVIGGSMIAAAFLVLIVGGGARDGAAEEPPSLTIEQPRAGGVPDTPFRVVFRVPARLRQGPAGWESGRFHLHAAVDGAEFMPGPTDIEPLGADRYRWTPPPLAPGRHVVRLFWSGPDHRAVAGGPSDSDTVEIKGET